MTGGQAERHDGRRSRRMSPRPVLVTAGLAADTATVRLACRSYGEPKALHASCRPRRPVR